MAGEHSPPRLRSRGENSHRARCVDRRMSPRRWPQRIGSTSLPFAVHTLTVALLAASVLLYGVGVRRLWRRAGRGRGIRTVEVTCFGLGLLVLALALLSPLHHYAAAHVWAHMVQHELLMVVAAPLLVLGRPLEAWSWVVAFRLPRFLSNPIFAWALHAMAIWLWHVPALFLAAVENQWVHIAQHASFFVPAAMFWWTVVA